MLEREWGGLLDSGAGPLPPFAELGVGEQCPVLQCEGVRAAQGLAEGRAQGPDLFTGSVLQITSFAPTIYCSSLLSF